MQRDVGASGRPPATIRAAIPDDLDLLPEDSEDVGSSKGARIYDGNQASRARLAADIEQALEVFEVLERLEAGSEAQG